MAEIETENDFTVWDYVVFVAVLVISASIGVVYGCIKSRQKSTEEFLMANREMTVFPVTLSLLASFMSAITLLGTPAEIYVFGTEYMMIVFGYAIMIPLAAHVFIPVFYKLKVTSVFEYLEMRFESRGLRIAGAFAFIIQMVLYMAIVLYAPSLALNAGTVIWGCSTFTVVGPIVVGRLSFTGVNVWISVFSVGLVCTFYTTLGGMKAVMWTDVFQIFIMFAGLIAILIKGSAELGGFDNVWKYMKDGERVQFLNFDPNPLERHTIWSLVFGGCFTWLAIFGVNQAQVQRCLCTDQLRTSQIALWLNLPGLSLLLIVCSLCGMVMYGHYRDCDPLETDRIDARDQLLPLYVMDVVDIPGIPGLFTACLFSGALSTISSGLNSLAAVTLEDIVRLLCFPKLTDTNATKASKLLAFGYGVVMIALTFVAAELGGVLQAALALFGMIGGPVLGLFMLGMLYPCSNKQGAWVGFILSLVLTVWLGVSQQVYKPETDKPPVSTECPDQHNLWNATWNYTTTVEPDDDDDDPADSVGYLRFYELSYLWLGTFAIFVVTVAGLLVSAITGGNKDKKINPDHLVPIFDIFCCCLPGRLRETLRCHVDYTLQDKQDNEYRLDQNDKATFVQTNGNCQSTCSNPVDFTHL